MDNKRIYEMAKADLENVDLSQEPDKIASQYIKNYEKRTGKKFSKQAAVALKKQLDKQGHEPFSDVKKIVDAAKQQAGLDDGDKKKAKEGKDEKMHQAVKKQAKKAYDAYNESFADLVRKHAGVEDKFRDNIISEDSDKEGK